MANQYTISGNVLPIYPSGYQATLSLINFGVSNTIYLGSNTSLSPSSGFPLGPGDVLLWDAKRPLYAVTGSNTLTATLVVDENSGTFTSAGAIANSLIQDGLAQQIAYYSNSLITDQLKWSGLLNDYPIGANTAPTVYGSAATVGSGNSNGYAYLALPSPSTAGTSSLYFPYFPMHQSPQNNLGYTYVSMILPTQFPTQVGAIYPWTVAYGWGYQSAKLACTTAIPSGPNIYSANFMGMRVNFDNTRSLNNRMQIQFQAAGAAGSGNGNTLTTLPATAAPEVLSRFFSTNAIWYLNIIDTTAGGQYNFGQTEYWLGCSGTKYVFHSVVPTSYDSWQNGGVNVNSDGAFTASCGTFGQATNQGLVHISQLSLGYSTAYAPYSNPYPQYQIEVAA